MSKKNIDLIRQALGAAESSIKLAKQLLNEMEGGVPGASVNKDKIAELPGVLGTFDGENMVDEAGKVYPVPANYASKSMLVVGDTLKLVEEGKEKRFKQVDHVKRQKTTGTVTKKDGKWVVVTPEGSYKVLPATIDHFGAEVGSEVVLFVPAGNLTAPYGTIESLVKGSSVGKETAPKTEIKVEETPKKEGKAEKEEKPKKAAEKPVAPKKEEPKPEAKETPIVPVVEVPIPAPEPAAEPVSTPSVPAATPEQTVATDTDEDELT